MKVFNTLENSGVRTAVALGYFDGIHLAHMQVINKTVGFKASHGFVPTTFTFAINGLMPNKSSIKTILTDTSKIELFSRFGMEIVYMPLFSEIESMEAEDFFKEILVGKLNAGALVCGYDYSFGKGAIGDVDLLAEFCEQYNIELCVVNPIQIYGQLISSTTIRSFIAEGRICEANEMLGYSYFIHSKVCKGNQIGRTLGFPTINQYFEPMQVVPKYGVYHSTIYIDDHIYKGITNVGVKPTFGFDSPVCAETHVVGLDEDVYDRDILVCLNNYIREERKFDNIDELKSAMQFDLDKLFFR